MFGSAGVSTLSISRHPANLFNQTAFDQEIFRASVVSTPSRLV